MWVPKQYQLLYYKSLLDEMKNLEFHKDMERLYQEHVNLYKKLFMI